MNLKWGTTVSMSDDSENIKRTLASQMFLKGIRLCKKSYEKNLVRSNQFYFDLECGKKIEN